MSSVPESLFYFVVPLLSDRALDRYRFIHAFTYRSCSVLWRAFSAHARVLRFSNISFQFCCSCCVSLSVSVPSPYFMAVVFPRFIFPIGAFQISDCGAQLMLLLPWLYRGPTYTALLCSIVPCFCLGIAYLWHLPLPTADVPTTFPQYLTSIDLFNETTIQPHWDTSPLMHNYHTGSSLEFPAVHTPLFVIPHYITILLLWSSRLLSLGANKTIPQVYSHS